MLDELVRDASVLRGLSRLLERGLRLVHRLPMLDRDRRAETAGHELIRRKHVDECHFGLLLRGELESEGDCLLGVRRTVGGDDDLLHGSSFLDQDARGATARRHPEIRGLGVRISADKLNLVADRMRALLDAGIAISSELSLDSLLQKLAETAAELTAARYAALGVIDPSGRELERFLTHGIDPETHAAIGDLPRGRGILGVLIRDATPLRLPDLSADARSVGFPPHHPPMKTFLGVPILLRGMAYGNLYLTEKDGGAEFTEEDEEIVTLLASQAAVAIENARLYEAATRWSRQLESLNEVGNAMATEIEPQAILDLVARRLHALIDARILTIWLPTRNGKLRVDTVSGDGAEALLGLETDLSETKTGRVFRAARSARVDSVLDDPEIEHDVARQVGARARTRRPHAPGRAPARRRAPPEGARRLRASRGARAADHRLRGADRRRGRARVPPRRRALAERDRDGFLQDRPGGANECRQARPGRARQHCPHAEGLVRDGGDRGRRARVQPRRRRRGPGSRGHA